MKKEMTLTANANTKANRPSATDTIVTTVRKALLFVARYYSDVLGTDISIRQTLLLINAQTAFFLTVFTVECLFIVRLACLAWLITALVKCKRGGIRTSC